MSESRLWLDGSPDSAASFGFHPVTEITEGPGEKVVYEEAAAWLEASPAAAQNPALCRASRASGASVDPLRAPKLHFYSLVSEDS